MDQVLAERDPLVDHRLALVLALDQLGQELLCVALAGPGHHPPPTVLARQRVRPVIDDGVPLLALLRD